MKNKALLIALPIFCVAVVVIANLTLTPKDMPDSAEEPAGIIDVQPTPEATVAPSIYVPSIYIQPTKKPTESANASTSPKAGTTINGTDISLTAIEPKPTPPAQEDTSDEEEHVQPTDPALTNMDVTPSPMPKPTPTPKPVQSTPKPEDKNSKGEVWVPGFGWVKDSGANIGETSDGKGSMDVMVGY